MQQPPISSAEIRTAFLDYFKGLDHEIKQSSSLIPHNDATLLFTAAGMVPFKDVFLGQEPYSHPRATSSQRCLRAGGKHNDLENVGYTARHHTFFEMLGNFSFGDYFKKEAITFAWQFLTEVLNLPEEKLWVTVHISDDESEKIWKEEIGIDPTRFSKLDEDNFWQMGDVGPCGPSSEIFYDHGEGVFGDPPGGEHDDGDRYIEIWNLVFMQYEKDATGKLNPLPNPSIDTGMGLERIAAVMQGVHNNYEIDLFQHLLKAAAKLLKVEDLSLQSLRVIADHIRACAFLIVDGVLPGNEGRGYVLRRIIRRAIRHGNKLGAVAPFFHQLVTPLIEVMGQAYPELTEHKALIVKTLNQEEQQFAITLDNGMAILEKAISELKTKVIPGEVIFKLYDTYGFPVDLTNDIAREKALTLDIEGFDLAMAEQKARSKASGQFAADYTQQVQLSGTTQFIGYDHLSVEASVSALLNEQGETATLKAGQTGIVVLDKTPFYAESGGQVGDKGVLSSKNMQATVTNVTPKGQHFFHAVNIKSGAINEGDKVFAEVSHSERRATAQNHSATHLLHAVLRDLLGTHVMQKGSLNDSEKLRFDFSHNSPLTAVEIRQIEDRVNLLIRANSLVNTAVMSMDEAQQKGAMALFGEKYGDKVRVLTMAEGYSVELCGGTHVNRTGDLGLFKIVAESSVASGIRRIEAITGEKAYEQFQAKEDKLKALAELLKSNEANLLDKADKLLQKQKQLEKQIQQLQLNQLQNNATNNDDLKDFEIEGIKVQAQKLHAIERKALLSLLDQKKNKLGSAVILLASVNEQNQIDLVAGVTKDLTIRIKAGDLMKIVSSKLAGKGGGRPDMAQGAGKALDQLDKVLDHLDEDIKSLLS